MRPCSAPWPSSSLLMNALRYVSQTSVGVITGSSGTPLGAQDVRKKFDMVATQTQARSWSQTPHFRTRMVQETEFCTLWRLQGQPLHRSGLLASGAFSTTF